MLPTLQPVDSSVLEAVGYNGQTQSLYVRFVRPPGVWVYHDVEQAVFDALMASDSKGDYFNRVIRENYRQSSLKVV